LRPIRRPCPQDVDRAAESHPDLSFSLWSGTDAEPSSQDQEK